MSKILKVSVKSKLSGRSVSKSVLISFANEELDSPDFSKILMDKTIRKMNVEFNGSIPKEFGFNMRLVSAKEL